MPPLEPEYPSLSPVDLREGPSIRLARSKRGFDQKQQKLIHSLSALSAKEAWLREIIGDVGVFTQGNTSTIDEWLRGWRMPSAVDPRQDVESSRAVFVGVVNSKEMPSSSSASSNAPHASITTQFIRMCSRISEVFPQFVQLLKSEPSPSKLNEYRNIFLLDHLDLATEKNPQLSNALRAGRDALFSIRTTKAAVRWAIAHEMAHLIIGRKARRAAYARVTDLYPNLEREQWDPKHNHLQKHENWLKRYRDEIACDLLAIDFVLASPFANDDLITEVTGSLVALEAIKWDGWFKDQSAISGTHPSPTLRFKIVMRAWLEKLAEPETWKDRTPPGKSGMDDIAYLATFGEWSVGAYGPHRKGAVWEEDLTAIRSLLFARIPRIVDDQCYAQVGADTFQLRSNE